MSRQWKIQRSKGGLLETVVGKQRGPASIICIHGLVDRVVRFLSRPMGKLTTGMTVHTVALQLGKAGKEKEVSCGKLSRSTSPDRARLWRSLDERVSHGSPRVTEPHRSLRRMAEGGSFLPRLQSVFYAVFYNEQHPKIVYQVA